MSPDCYTGPPHAPPTLLTTALLYLYVLVWGGGFCYLGPLTHLQLRRPALSIRPGGGGGGVGGDTWSPLCTPESSVSVYPCGEGWCCDQVPLAHPQLCRSFCSARESQITPQIPTRMSFVGSLDPNSRSSHHDLCCNINTVARPIQIEEKALRTNAFIFQGKERYLRSRILVVYITMPLAAANCGVTSLSLNDL